MLAVTSLDSKYLWEEKQLCVYVVPNFKFLATYYLTQWSTGLPEKLTGPQLTKKFLAYFTTAFTYARHLHHYPEPRQPSPCPIHIFEDPF
jgi:hypothetical protein